MPTAEQILAGLSGLANGWQALAVVWHVYFALLVVLLLSGKRCSQRVLGMLLGLPLLAVSALAWLAANPFNASFFAVAGAASIAIALRLPRAGVRRAPPWAVAAGSCLFVFGWVYPHFLEPASMAVYL